MPLTDEAKELRRQYMRKYKREWQRKNKDKVKIYQERYWNKKAMQEQKINHKGEIDHG